MIAATSESDAVKTCVYHLSLVVLPHLVGADDHMMGRRDSPSYRRHDSPPHRSHMNETENGIVEGHMPMDVSSAVGR